MDDISEGESARSFAAEFDVYAIVSLAVFKWGVLCPMYHCIGVGKIPTDVWDKVYI